MKISIITVCYNSEETILSTLNSVISQTYKDIEHIIIDGGSIDRTLDILKNYKSNNKILISEPDKGIYDAMNKGISLASGEIISILNSDDIYQSPKVIEEVINQILKHPEKEIFLGDVVFFKQSNFNKILRYYSAKNFKKEMLLTGIMPPHPASFIRKKTYLNNGFYKSSLSIAADFEMFLRLIYVKKKEFLYLNKIIVRMRSGGKSGKNLKTYFTSTKEIVSAFKWNKLDTNFFKILLRLPGKVSQFFFLYNLNQKPSFKIFKNLIKNQPKDTFNIIKNIDRINFKQNFILSGMNLAFLGYYSKGDVFPYKNLFHWPDGIFVKNLSRKIEKIPGRMIVQNLSIPKDIKNIFILGNCKQRSFNFIKKKYKNKNIKKFKLPYGSAKYIIDNCNIKINEKTLVYITLPTPKQEQLAYHLARNNKNYRIICIGASIMIASGDEKVVPYHLENFEFLWRLRTDTVRRFKRLLESLTNFFIGKFITKKFRKVKVNIID